MKLFGWHDDKYYFFGLNLCSIKRNDNYIRIYLFGIRIWKILISSIHTAERLNFTHDDSHTLRRAIIPTKSVLLVEPHNSGGHGAFIMPYAKYFLDLGYSVDIITTLRHAEEKFYCRYNFNGDLRAFFLDFRNPDTYSLIFSIALLYDLVIDTTKHDGRGGGRWTYISFDDWYSLYVTKYHRNNLFFISHDHDFIENVVKNYDSKKATYAIEHCLSSSHKVAQKSDVLWPLDNSLIISHDIHHKGFIANFLSVGIIEDFIKDYNLLFDTMRELIASGITNFHVTVVGLSGDIEKFNISNLDQHLTICIASSYERMFLKINECDFMLSLLTPKKHDKYLHETSGTYYQSVGFSRPQIIEKNFAKRYNFDHESAVIYSDTDLLSAMRYAISMTQAEFKEMCAKVSKMRDVFIEEGKSCAKRILDVAKR